jgi:hypothetical protein
MKLALFYDLIFNKVYNNLEAFVIIWTLCKICLFEFICMEGGVKSMKHFKGGASYDSLGTCGLVTQVKMPRCSGTASCNHSGK